MCVCVSLCFSLFFPFSFLSLSLFSCFSVFLRSTGVWRYTNVPFSFLHIASFHFLAILPLSHLNLNPIFSVFRHQHHVCVCVFAVVILSLLPPSSVCFSNTHKHTKKHLVYHISRFPFCFLLLGLLIKLTVTVM